MSDTTGPLSDRDYQRLATFRHTAPTIPPLLRRGRTREGLTPSQHQLLLAVRGRPHPDPPTIRSWPTSSNSGSTPPVNSRATPPRQGSSRSARTPTTTGGTVELSKQGEDVLRALSVMHREELRRIRTHISSLVEILD